MIRHRLAEELRERQYQLRQAPRASVDALSDDEIIEAYIACSHCGEKQVDAKQLKAAISQAEHAEHFFAICSRAAHHKAYL